MHCPGTHEDAGHKLVDYHHNYVLMEQIIQLKWRIQMNEGND